MNFILIVGLLTFWILQRTIIHEEENKMSRVQVLTDETFDQMIQSDKPVLVDFFATWCGPCKMLAPVLEEIADELKDKLSIAKLDVDLNPETTQKYGVMSMPTLILFKNGKPVKQHIGYAPKSVLIQKLEPELN
jgi:thioredoxin 1